MKTASVTDLRDNLSDVFDRLEIEKSLMIMKHSKPAAYLVTPEAMDEIMTSLEEYEDLRDAVERMQDVQGLSQENSIESVRNRLSL
ncbi:MAG TPA: type II toxin-antitoxin system Phd/YefM family antitoxin [Pelolinea sp.]|nr:type II toxin-antitoxin system Phd/YefM family antitoxin [Pelolinea sp.]